MSIIETLRKQFSARISEAKQAWANSTLPKGTIADRRAGLDEGNTLFEEVLAALPPERAKRTSQLEVDVPALIVTEDQQVMITVQLAGALALWMIKNTDPAELTQLLCQHEGTRQALERQLGYDVVYERVDRLVEQLSAIDQAWAEKFGVPPEDTGDTRAWYRRVLLAQFGMVEPR